MLTRPRVSLALALLGALFSGATRSSAEHVDRNRIEACPPSPNCVSSRSQDPSRHVAPLKIKIRVTSDKAWDALKAALAAEERTSIVEEQRGDGYLRAEASSLVFGFVDDVEFQILPEDHLIHLRSASRVGYWDLGVNLRRVERIGSRLRDAGIVK